MISAGLKLIELPICTLTPEAFAPYGTVIPPMEDGMPFGLRTPSSISAVGRRASTRCACRHAASSSSRSPAIAS